RLSIGSKPEKLIVLKQSPLRKDRMDIHKNARLTPVMRYELVQRVVSGYRLRAAAAAFNVSPKTAAKWTRRFLQFGRSGLYDRSSRPHRLYRPTPSSLVEQVARLRHQRWTGSRIAHALTLSPATVSRILRRLRLNRLRDLEPAPPIVRYEHPAPGDLLHLDIETRPFWLRRPPYLWRPQAPCQASGLGVFSRCHR